jgi:ABC-2 type transport system permease protein
MSTISETMPAAGPRALDDSMWALDADTIRVPWYQVVYIVWLRDLVRYTRDRPRLIASFAQPVLYLLIFGVGLSSSLGRGFSSEASTSGSSISYIQFMYPGTVTMAVLFIAIFSAMSVVWDREFGFLREILVAPVGRAWVALGKALGGATQAMIQGIIMLVLAPLVGIKLTPASVAEVIPLLFVLAFGPTTFGVFLATRMKSMQGFQVVINFLMQPMFFLSGAIFPLQNVPGWMSVLTRLDPVAYGVAPIRAAVLRGSGLPPGAVTKLTAITIFGWQVPSLVDVLILLAFGVLMLLLAMRSFSRRV